MEYREEQIQVEFGRRYDHPKPEEGFRDDRELPHPNRHITGWYLTSNGNSAGGSAKTHKPILSLNRRYALPRKGRFTADHILKGVLEPASSDDTERRRVGSDDGGTKVVVTRLVMWVVDRSSPGRGVWVQSSGAWYKLLRPNDTPVPIGVNVKPMHGLLTETHLGDEEEGSRKRPGDKATAYLPTQETMHLPLRAKFQLLSNLIDLLSEPYNGVAHNYIPIHAKRSPENIHSLLSPSEEILAECQSAEEPLNLEPFDLALLRTCPKFVRHHLAHYHERLDAGSAFMRGLDDMIRSNGGKGGEDDSEDEDDSWKTSALLSSSLKAELRGQRMPWGDPEPGHFDGNGSCRVRPNRLIDLEIRKAEKVTMKMHLTQIKKEAGNKDKEVDKNGENKSIVLLHGKEQKDIVKNLEHTSSENRTHFDDDDSDDDVGPVAPSWKRDATKKKKALPRLDDAVDMPLKVSKKNEGHPMRNQDVTNVLEPEKRPTNAMMTDNVLTGDAAARINVISPPGSRLSRSAMSDALAKFKPYLQPVPSDDDLREGTYNQFSVPDDKAAVFLEECVCDFPDVPSLEYLLLAVTSLRNTGKKGFKKALKGMFKAQKGQPDKLIAGRIVFVSWLAEAVRVIQNRRHPDMIVELRVGDERTEELLACCMMGLICDFKVIRGMKQVNILKNKFGVDWVGIVNRTSAFASEHGISDLIDCCRVANVHLHDIMGGNVGVGKIELASASKYMNAESVQIVESKPKSVCATPATSKVKERITTLLASAESLEISAAVSLEKHPPNSGESDAARLLKEKEEKDRQRRKRMANMLKMAKSRVGSLGNMDSASKMPPNSNQIGANTGSSMQERNWSVEQQLKTAAVVHPLRSDRPSSAVKGIVKSNEPAAATSGPSAVDSGRSQMEKGDVNRGWGTGASENSRASSTADQHPHSVKKAVWGSAEPSNAAAGWGKSPHVVSDSGGGWSKTNVAGWGKASNAGSDSGGGWDKTNGGGGGWGVTQVKGAFKGNPCSGGGKWSSTSVKGGATSGEESRKSGEASKMGSDFSGQIQYGPSDAPDNQPPQPPSIADKSTKGCSRNAWGGQSDRPMLSKGPSSSSEEKKSSRKTKDNAENSTINWGERSDRDKNSSCPTPSSWNDHQNRSKEDTSQQQLDNSSGHSGDQHNRWQRDHDHKSSSHEGGTERRGWGTGSRSGPIGASDSGSKRDGFDYQRERWGTGNQVEQRCTGRDNNHDQNHDIRGKRSAEHHMEADSGPRGGERWKGGKLNKHPPSSEPLSSPRGDSINFKNEDGEIASDSHHCDGALERGGEDNLRGDDQFGVRLGSDSRPSRFNDPQNRQDQWSEAKRRRTDEGGGPRVLSDTHRSHDKPAPTNLAVGATGGPGIGRGRGRGRGRGKDVNLPAWMTQKNKDGPSGDTATAASNSAGNNQTSHHGASTSGPNNASIQDYGDASHGDATGSRQEKGPMEKEDAPQFHRPAQYHDQQHHSRFDADTGGGRNNRSFRGVKGRHSGRENHNRSGQSPPSRFDRGGPGGTGPGRGGPPPAAAASGPSIGRGRGRGRGRDLTKPAWMTRQDAS